MKAGTNWRTSQYPGLPADEILSAVHRFYDEYYFRPKAVFRILKKGRVRQQRPQAALQGSEDIPEAAFGAQQDGEEA